MAPYGRFAELCLRRRGCRHEVAPRGRVSGRGMRQHPVNAVAPEPVRGAEYAKTLDNVIGRPATLRVPAAGPRLLLGAEGAREIAEASQRVSPAALTSAGHQFRFRPWMARCATSSASAQPRTGQGHSRSFLPARREAGHGERERPGPCP